MEIKLYYEEQGSGEPLILLHGNGEDHTYFEHQIACFSASRRVIAVDTRGHGKSPRGDKPFTIRQFAEDLRYFMDGLSIEKADLLGFSDGGNIALVFALNYPHRVNRLILNGANLDAGGVKPSTQIPIVLGYKIASFFARKSPDARKNAEMLGLMVNDPHISSEELSKVKAHTLVIAGRKDMIKEAHTRLIAEKIPRSELAILPGGHFIAARNPTAFNRIVEEFLNGPA